MAEEREEKKAVQYAEQTLGVHATFEQANELLAELESALHDLVAAAQAIRRLNDSLETRELELTIEARADNSEASGAAIERIVKETRLTDDDYTSMKADLRSRQQEHDEAEAQVTLLKYRLRVLSGRLNELGGLTTFYAATK